MRTAQDRESEAKVPSASGQLMLKPLANANSLQGAVTSQQSAKTIVIASPHSILKALAQTVTKIQDAPAIFESIWRPKYRSEVEKAGL